MSEYEIGKDVAMLSDRLNKLETAFTELLEHLQQKEDGTQNDTTKR